MAAVLEFAGVTVRRGRATLLADIDWTVEEDERWVILGPNGAGKTTLLQVASAQVHPTTGVAGILEEVLGTVDVFELRPRIGLTSASLADRIPRGETFSGGEPHAVSLEGTGRVPLCGQQISKDIVTIANSPLIPEPESSG